MFSWECPILIRLVFGVVISFFLYKKNAIFLHKQDTHAIFIEEMESMFSYGIYTNMF